MTRAAANPILFLHPHSAPAATASRRLSAAACALLAAGVLLISLSAPGINRMRRAGLGDMVYGRAHKPFVYRILLPGTVRLLVSAIPTSTRASLAKAGWDNPFVGRFIRRFGGEREYVIEMLLAVALMYLALLGYAAAVRYFLTGLFRVPETAANLVPPIALLALPPFFAYHTYLYDFATLFLFTLGLGLIAWRRWALYALLFPLACLSKETTILLTLVFVLHFRDTARMERPLFGRLLLYQLAVFTVVKVALFIAFRHNHGNLIEFHLLDHNIPLFKAALKPYSFSTLLLGLALAALLLYRWSEKPLLLRHACWVLPP